MKTKSKRALAKPRSKKRNPQDATLRNIRALRKELETLKKEVKDLAALFMSEAINSASSSYKFRADLNQIWENIFALENKPKRKKGEK